MHQLLILMFVFFAGMHESVALSCYNCTFKNAACLDPFAKSASGVPTATGNDWCWKVTEGITGYQYIARGAGANYNSTVLLCIQSGCTVYSTPTLRGLVCCCDTNLCNNSNLIKINGLMFFAILLLIILRH